MPLLAQWAKPLPARAYSSLPQTRDSEEHYPHSSLSATRSSTPAARRAGSQHATSATAIHTATAADRFCHAP